MTMSRTFILTVLALGIFVVAPVALEAQTGSVSGVVTNDSGDTLPGVIVRALDGSGGWGGWGNSDFTDIDGMYLIDDLAPGTYEIRAFRFGYEPMTAMVDVVDGVDTVQDFTLSAPTFGTVAGTVTDGATGLPIENARVRVIGGGFFGGFFGNFDMTDANGEYTIDDVRTGDREARFTKQGYFTQTTTVTITDSATTTADAALDPLSYGSISGTVTDAATSTPIEGAFVIVRGSGGFFGGWNFTVTDAAGTYSFDDLVTGDREVRVFSQGYFSQMETVTVTDGANTVADFALGEFTFGIVSGTVTDAVTGEAVEGAWVIVETGGWTQTNRTGMYQVTDVLTGTRTVRVFAQGYIHDSQEVDVSEGQASTADFAIEPR